MKIELTRKVRTPAHLAGEVGDKMEVSAGDGETLINGNYAKIVTTERQRKKKDGETTKQKSDPGSG